LACKILNLLIALMNPNNEVGITKKSISEDVGCSTQWTGKMMRELISLGWITPTEFKDRYMVNPLIATYRQRTSEHLSKWRYFTVR
jgi:DNA-binding IclR family transcriptional regulator